MLIEEFQRAKSYADARHRDAREANRPESVCVGSPVLQRKYKRGYFTDVAERSRNIEIIEYACAGGTPRVDPEYRGSGQKLHAVERRQRDHVEVAEPPGHLAPAERKQALGISLVERGRHNSLGYQGPPPLRERGLAAQALPDLEQTPRIRFVKQIQVGAARASLFRREVAPQRADIRPGQRLPGGNLVTRRAICVGVQAPCPTHRLTRSVAPRRRVFAGGKCAIDLGNGFGQRAKAESVGEKLVQHD